MGASCPWVFRDGRGTESTAERSSSLRRRHTFRRMPKTISNGNGTILCFSGGITVLELINGARGAPLTYGQLGGVGVVVVVGVVGVVVPNAFSQRILNRFLKEIFFAIDVSWAEMNDYRS